MISEIQTKRLTWLLDFLQRDLTAIRQGASKDLIDDLLAWAAPVVYGDVVIPSDLLSLMIALQTKLNKGIDDLEIRSSWQPFNEEHRPPIVIFDKRVKMYHGLYEDILLVAAADLLVEVWHLLRRCELKTCRRLFLPGHGRQRFHDIKCANLARFHRPSEERKKRKIK